MPNIITQHRRGTKHEWELSGVKPAPGELVVEQEAGISKIKIGTGVNTYSELPYITDPVEAKLDVQANRVDNLIAIATSPNSSLTPNSIESEVVDIRTGYDGIYHRSAGEAVRAIGYDLETLEAALSDFKDKEAVDGLEYEDNMLYLTASGQRVGEGVEVIGGSGGGGGTGTSQIVRLKNLNDSSKISIVKGNEATITFQFISTEDGEPTGDISYIIAVNGVDREKGSSRQTTEGAIISRPIAKYLTTGENKVKVTCEDIYGNTRYIQYTVNVIELRLTSAFDSGAPIVSDIDFRYIAYGVIDKTVYFELDGKVIAEAPLRASTSGKEISQYIPLTLTDAVGNPIFTHGSHTLKVYARAIYDSLLIESNTLSYGLLIAAGDDNPIIASVFNEKEVEQGSLVSIPYLIYHGTKTKFDVELKITYIEEGKEKLYSSDRRTPDNTQQYWQTRNYPVSDQVTFWIIYYYGDDNSNQIFIKHTLKVTASDFKVDAEPNPRLFLSSQNRSNTEANPGVWEFTPQLSGGAQLPTVTTTFTGFNWKTNGWIPDSDSNTCLRLNGDARAIINFAPFSTNNFNISNNGLTFEIDFAVRDVNTRNSIIAECFSENKGIQLTADTATIRSAADKISCNYRDNEKLRLAFTIDKTGKAATGYDSAQFLSMYLNGTLSRIIRYTNSNFNHDGVIKLGSSSCSLDIYSIRIYDKALSSDSILNNYLADIGNPEEQKELFAANDLYDADHTQITLDKVKDVIPVITFTGTMPKFKGDKQTVEMDFIHPFEPNRSFSSWYGGPIPVEIDVQGTSSQYYIRKNWKFKIKKDADGNTLPAFQHMKDQIPAKVFCIKVDYAEATGTHNTQNANYVETFYSEQIPPKKDDARARSTIAGYPCAIFQRATVNDDFVFSSKGNFNFDKGSEDAFGFNENYDTECWEFCNNTSDACNFKGEIPIDWVDDFEPRYFGDSDATDLIESLQEQKDNATNKTTGEIDRTQFTEAMENQLLDVRTSTISEFRKMHSWVVSTNTTTATNTTLAEPETFNGIQYTIDSAEYRLAKFKNEFDNYFDRHFACIYYVYTLVALMTDQRAKNLFLTRWKVRGADGVTRDRWYPYFYDNDTCFGINNEGQLVFDYYHEDTDKVGDTNVYNGQESVLWTNFSRAFAADIAATYSSLRSSGKLSANAIIERFITDGSNSWSAAIYNEDAEYKYVGMARPENAANNEDYGGTEEDESGKLITSNLYQVRGTGEHHLKYFIENRIRYCDSKWNAGNYPNEYVLLRVNTPTISDTASTDDIDSSITLEAGASYSFFIVGEPGTVDLQITSKSTKPVNYQQQVTLTEASYKYTFRAEFEDEYSIVCLTPGYAFKKPTVSDPDLAESIRVYPPNPAITLTPFSTMYAGVKYKANGTLEQHRTFSNESYTFGTKLNELFNDTETAVFGAKDISSLGDLSRVYPSIVDVSSATKLTELIIGAPAPYRNKMLHEVQLGTNYLLKTLNVENCVGLSNALDLSGCPNIENIYAKGSSITSVNLPEAGYLNKFEVPNTLVTLILSNQVNLTNDNLTIGTNKGDLQTQNLTDLVIDNCIQLDADEIFSNCFTYSNGEYSTNLRRIRLTNVDWKLDDWHKLQLLYSKYKLSGLSSSGALLTETALPIYGKCYINNDSANGGVEMTGTDLGELHKYFPYLEFSYAKAITFTVTFKSDDQSEILRIIEVTENSIEASDCPDPVTDPINPLTVPVRARDIQYTYKFNGWSSNKNLNRIADNQVLNNIVGDIVVYPAFEYIVNTYDAYFYANELDQATNADPFYILPQVPYGRDFVYDKADPITGNVIYPEYSTDAKTSELHPFARWSPSLLISEDTLDMSLEPPVFKTAAIYYTIDEQFEIPNAYKTIDSEASEITFTSNIANNTLAITGRTPFWSDEPNVFVQIPASYYLPDYDKTFYVDSITGFDNFDQLTLIDFGKNVGPNSVISDEESRISQFPSTTAVIDGKVETIGAFQNCPNLLEAVLPKSLRYLGPKTFAYDNSLQKVKLYSTNLSSSSGSFTNANAPFPNCASLNGFEVIVGEDVKEIPSFLFYSSSNASNSSALVNKLTWHEPSNCTSIGASAFYRANLSEVAFGSAIKTIDRNAFQENARCSELILPSHVETIQNSAFRKWSNLKKVTFENPYVNLASGTFGFNTALEEIIVNRSIGAIPDDVQSILSVVDVNQTIDRRQKVLLIERSKDNSITLSLATKYANQIPSNVTKIGSYAFSGLDIKSLEFDTSSQCLVIEEGAFYQCRSLVSVDPAMTSDSTQQLKLPDTLTSIEDRAFAYCTALQYLEIPSQLTKVSPQCFESCSSLAKVKLPNILKSIDYSAFNRCTNLISLPNFDRLTELTSIGNSAFAETGLSTLIMPNSVTSLGTNAFSGCKKLTNIQLSESLTQLQYGTFANSNIQKIRIPNNVIALLSETSTSYKGVFADCLALEEVELGPNIKVIGEETFLNCGKQTRPLKLIIPSSLDIESIEGYENKWGAKYLTIERKD